MSRNSFNKPAVNDLLDRTDIYAIKALSEGVASDRQQKIALNAIINKICRMGRNSFCEDSPNTTAFNEGVRYVGIQINTTILCDVKPSQQ